MVIAVASVHAIVERAPKTHGKLSVSAISKPAPVGVIVTSSTVRIESRDPELVSHRLCIGALFDSEFSKCVG